MNTDFSLLQKLENLLQKLSKMQPLLQKLLSTFVGKCNSQLKLIRMKTYVDKLLHFLNFVKHSATIKRVMPMVVLQTISLALSLIASVLSIVKSCRDLAD